MFILIGSTSQYGNAQYHLNSSSLQPLTYRHFLFNMTKSKINQMVNNLWTILDKTWMKVSAQPWLTGSLFIWSEQNYSPSSFITLAEKCPVLRAYLTFSIDQWWRVPQACIWSWKYWTLKDACIQMFPMVHLHIQIMT